MRPTPQSSKVQGGGAGQELQDIRDKIQQLVQSYRSDSSKTYISSLDRLTELMENLSLLSTELSVNYMELRHKLEAATNVAKQQADVQTKAAEASRADLDAEHKKHDDERQILVNKVGEQQTDIDKKTTENANLRRRSSRSRATTPARRISSRRSSASCAIGPRRTRRSSITPTATSRTWTTSGARSS